MVKIICQNVSIVIVLVHFPFCHISNHIQAILIHAITVIIGHLKRMAIIALKYMPYILTVFLPLRCDSLVQGVYLPGRLEESSKKDWKDIYLYTFQLCWKSIKLSASVHEFLVTYTTIVSHKSPHQIMSDVTNVVPSG